MNDQGGESDYGRRVGGGRASPSAPSDFRRLTSPAFTVEPQKRRVPSRTTVGVVLAILLALAALVIALLPQKSQPAPAASPSGPQAGTAADKA